MDYNIVAGVEVKVDVYGGDNCDEHTPYLESWCEGDIDTVLGDRFTFDSKRWPVGTKMVVQVPMCPNPDCHVDAEYQNEDGKCTECGFDWVNWIEEKYS